MALTKVTGGLLGNLPTGTGNVAVGDTALDSIASGAQYNVAIGSAAGTALTTGDFNVAVGYAALDATTTGSRNVGVGQNALGSDTLGSRSTAVGQGALGSQNFTSSTDAYNVAVGTLAGNAVTTGIRNTLIGALAGDALTDTDNNVAIGYSALGSDTLGINSIAIGFQALLNQNFTTPTDSHNVAIGVNAGKEITNGDRTTLVGNFAGDALTTADGNTAVGYSALSGETGSELSVAIGFEALKAQNVGSGSAYNVGVGALAGHDITTGVGNTFLGGLAGTSSTGSGVDNNTFIGFQAGRYVTSGEKNTVLGRYDGNQGSLDIRTTSNNIVISDGDGNPRIWVSPGGNTLFEGDVLPRIDAGFTGHSDLGDPSLRFEDAYVRDGVTTGSDEQDKTAISGSDLGLDFIDRLNPVSYRWNDGSRTHYGLIAQQLEAVISEVGKSNTDFAGIIKNDSNIEDREYTYGIRYQELIAPMIKAIQELSAENAALTARIEALES